MDDYITLPCALLKADAKTLWAYANLAATAGDGGLAEIKVSRWCEEIGLTHQQLRDALNWLSATNKITIETTNKTTRITICVAESCGGKPRRRQQAKRQAKQQTVTDKTLSGGLTSRPRFDFVAPMFEDAFATWIEYKEKELKERYKTERTLKAAYNKLVELSGNDPCTAMKIVEQSMAYRWKGLFELKTNGIKQQFAAAAGDYANRKERRDRGLSLANEIVSGSENLRRLYNGGCPDPDIGENQK